MPEETPLEDLIEDLRAKIASAAGMEEGLTDEDINDLYPELSRPYARWLVEHRRTNDLVRFADVMLEWMGSTNEARAEVDAWLGSYLKMLRLPKRFLDRVGDTPREWESQLSVVSRARLWTERANALRLIGRLEDALRLNKEIEQLLTDSFNQPNGPSRQWLHTKLYTARRNVAILLRETGSPDAALEILNSLLADVPEEQRIDLLESLAVTYATLGQLANAIHCYDEALTLATGPRASDAPAFRAARAAMLANLDRYEESLRDLMAFQPDLRSDPVTLLAEASAWVTLIAKRASLPPGAFERILLMFKHLTEILDEAEKRADVVTHLGALHLMGYLWEVIEKPDAECEQVWQHAQLASEQYEQPPDPVVLLSLAYYAYKRKKPRQARSYLVKVPMALVSLLGGVKDLAPAIEGSVLLERKLDQLTRVVLDHKRAWDDIRLIAELRRDAIGRAQIYYQQHLVATNISMLAEGLTDGVLARLAPETGRIGVLEWVDDGERIATFLTCIAADGAVSSHWLKPPEVNMRGAIKKIRDCLDNWRLDRGDPFNFSDWQTLEEWLVEGLSPYLAKDDHIVFIEHEDYVGAPWHVAAAPRWTSSYAAGWTALLSLRSLLTPNRATTVGVALVPCYGDAPVLLEAMRKSARRTQAFAGEYGLDFSMAEEEHCDRNAFREIMSGSDIAKLICHGFVAQDSEVALVLAHSGSLPLAANLVGGEAGRSYRLSWRDCQRLPSAPPVMFSAACSTGFSHIAGQGERLGLFSALRHAGTRAWVAPRWDIIADRVLPILDDALERYARGGVSLVRALHEACSAAEVEQPRWLAWALALEGDWQCNNHLLSS